MHARATGARPQSKPLLNALRLRDAADETAFAAVSARAVAAASRLAGLERDLERVRGKDDESGKDVGARAKSLSKR